jgi:hypothetical protein
MNALDNMASLHNQAVQAAQKATEDFLAQHGDRDACGFAWVTVYEKGSTRLGRALKELGFKPAYGGGLQLWNPSGSWTPTQKSCAVQALTRPTLAAEWTDTGGASPLLITLLACP